MSRRLHRPAFFVFFTIFIAIAMFGSVGARAQAPFQPHFSGMVSVAGHPADAGTTVQVEVITSPERVTSCGEATVYYAPRGLGQSWYDAVLDQKPDCLNPDTTYQFFVNGVFSGKARNQFTPESQLGHVNLAVSEVALKTKDEDGLVLFWFYGTVKDKFGRPAPKGTYVTAFALDASCSAEGYTEDIDWQPKTPNSRRFGARGFYWLAIPMRKLCWDREVHFDIFAGGSKVKASSLNVHTPPYGQAIRANLVLP